MRRNLTVPSHRQAGFAGVSAHLPAVGIFGIVSPRDAWWREGQSCSRDEPGCHATLVSGPLGTLCSRWTLRSLAISGSSWTETVAGPGSAAIPRASDTAPG